MVTHRIISSLRGPTSTPRYGLGQLRVLVWPRLRDLPIVVHERVVRIVRQVRWIVSPRRAVHDVSRLREVVSASVPQTLANMSTITLGHRSASGARATPLAHVVGRSCAGRSRNPMVVGHRWMTVALAVGVVSRSAGRGPVLMKTLIVVAAPCLIRV